MAKVQAPDAENFTAAFVFVPVSDVPVVSPLPPPVIVVVVVGCVVVVSVTVDSEPGCIWTGIVTVD